MNYSEFFAWFDGFSHSVRSRPTKKQWEVIKKQVELFNKPFVAKASELTTFTTTPFVGFSQGTVTTTPCSTTN